MKAVTWHGKRDVRVDTVPDPRLQEPTDAIIEVTSTNICGSDLHLYEILGVFMNAGDVVGHEPMGIVREVGSGGGSSLTRTRPGRRCTWEETPEVATPRRRASDVSLGK